jgi:predicted nucleotidyltransferase component of viral defense system
MYNYSKNFFSEKAGETHFIRDKLEKVFRLCEILQYLNETPLFAENLALKGGTAINLAIFAMPRLSVDIDLDFTKISNRDEMLENRQIINNELLDFMYAQGYWLSPHTKNPHSLDSWVFYFQNSAGNRDVLKVEINYSMRDHVLPIVKVKPTVDFVPLETKIATLHPLELFGSKINALVARSTPRDIYDVNNMLKFNIFPTKTEQDLLRKIAVFYMIVGGDYGKMDFDFSKIKNLKYPKIRSELSPLLKKTEHFDFEQAQTDVVNFVSELMTLTEGEKMFIENFNAGAYCPELLFDDSEIVERIKTHPMAVWKNTLISSGLTRNSKHKN